MTGYKDSTLQADLPSSRRAAISQVRRFSCLNLEALLAMHMQRLPLRERDHHQISGHGGATKRSCVYYLKYKAICIHGCMCDIMIS